MVPGGSTRTWLRSTVVGMATLLVASIVVVSLHPRVEWQYPFLHAVLESFGSFLAGIIAWHLFTLYEINRQEVFRVWMALAFLNMGVLDGFHALVGPGHIFVWFHSCAAFVGGVVSLLIWMPASWTPRVNIRKSLLACIVAYPFFGLFSVWYPHLVPHMMEQDEFSLIARGLNIGGGLAFVGTSCWFVRNYMQRRRAEDVLYASCYGTIGTSALLFEASTLWDPIWWWWHGLRFVSYGFIAYNAKTEFEGGLIRHVKATAQEAENQRFRLVVESAPCGMLMVNAAGIITLVNKHVETLFGYAREELIARPVEQLIPERFRGEHPGQRDRYFQSPIMRAMGAGRELFGVRKDGREVPIEIGLNPIETDDGHMVMASIIDITERKRAEEQFRLVVESAPCGLVMVDEAGTVLLVNPQLVQQFGYSQQELLGQPIENLVPERFRSRHPDHRMAFQDSPSARPMGGGRDLFGRRKDGSEFPVEIGLNPIQTSSGLRILATVADIGERKQAERQIRLSEFALTHVSVPTFWIDPDARVLRVNQATCNMLGYTEDELLRMRVSDVNPSFPADIWPAHWEELRENRHMRFESSVRHKDGHLLPVEITINFLQFEGREYNVAFVTDITERRRAEEHLAQQTAELSRSNSELEQFAYVASHDLQEPLRMVSSYCGLLSRRYQGKLDKDADDFIHFAVDGATRMKDLIDSLLLYSRVGRRGKPFVPINSTDNVQAALANLAMAVEEAGAEVTFGRLPVVYADSVQLTQVFQNLIGNALKFRGADRPRVHVSAQCESVGHDPSQWVFSVQDNGLGFEQEFSERVFVIFQRLHTREQYPGNGMGLAITKKIVERHGGRIWVKSAPGAGTTFYFTLRGQPSDSTCVASPEAVERPSSDGAETGRVTAP